MTLLADDAVRLDLDLGTDRTCEVFRDGRANQDPCDGFDKGPTLDAMRTSGKQPPLFMAAAFHKNGDWSYRVLVTKTESTGELDAITARAYVQKQIDSVAGRRTIRGGAEPHLSHIKDMQLVTYSVQLDVDKTNASYVVSHGTNAYLIATETDDAHAVELDAMIRKSLATIEVKDAKPTEPKSSTSYIAIAAVLAFAVAGLWFWRRRRR